MTGPTRRNQVTAVLGALMVIALDQLTKSWAVSTLVDRTIEVGGPLRFQLSYNRGAAFGLGGSVPVALLVVLTVAIMVWLYMSGALTTSAGSVGLGTVAGGALSNITDRLFRSHDGAVVDFIDVGWWPTFNLADSAIVVGITILLLVSYRKTEVA